MRDLSDQQVIDLISQALKQMTESYAVEFKDASGGIPHKTLWRTISSFSNSQGGWLIVFGVRECDCQMPQREHLIKILTI